MVQSSRLAAAGGAMSWRLCVTQLHRSAACRSPGIGGVALALGRIRRSSLPCAAPLVAPPLAVQACGTGVNLQVMPNSAVRRSALAGSAGEEGQLGLEASTSHLSLCQFDVDASYMSGGVLSADMSPGNSAHGGRGAEAALRGGGGLPPVPGRGAAAAAAEGRQHGGAGWQGGTAPSPRGPSATRTVLSMASKARDLLQKQGAIEAEVEDRWVVGARGIVPQPSSMGTLGGVLLSGAAAFQAGGCLGLAAVQAPKLCPLLCWYADGSALAPPAAVGWAPACRPCVLTCMGASSIACFASGGQGAAAELVAACSHACQPAWCRAQAGQAASWQRSSPRWAAETQPPALRTALCACSDSAGHTRFLVRGRAGASPASLLEAARQEAASVARAAGLPAATVEVVGGGLMEW